MTTYQLRLNAVFKDMPKNKYIAHRRNRHRSQRERVAYYVPHVHNTHPTGTSSRHVIHVAVHFAEGRRVQRSVGWHREYGTSACN